MIRARDGLNERHVRMAVERPELSLRRLQRHNVILDAGYAERRTSDCARIDLGRTGLIEHPEEELEQRTTHIRTDDPN